MSKVNRRLFLRYLGLGSAVVAFAPATLFAGTPANADWVKHWVTSDEIFTSPVIDSLMGIKFSYRFKELLPRSEFNDISII